MDRSKNYDVHARNSVRDVLAAAVCVHRYRRFFLQNRVNDNCE